MSEALVAAAAATGAPDPTNPFAGVDHVALRSDPQRAADLRAALARIDAVRAEAGLPPVARGITAMIDATAPSELGASRAPSLAHSLQPTRV